MINVASLSTSQTRSGNPSLKLLDLNYLSHVMLPALLTIRFFYSVHRPALSCLFYRPYHHLCRSRLVQLLGANEDASDLCELCFSFFIAST